MGRSKFPGKPPKTATRKRIKVLGQPEVAQNDPVTVAENIYYGLSLFNETFGDNEKVRGKKSPRRSGRRRRPPSCYRRRDRRVAVAVAAVDVAVAVAVADERLRREIDGVASSGDATQRRLAAATRDPRVVPPQDAHTVTHVATAHELSTAPKPCLVLRLT